MICHGRNWDRNSGVSSCMSDRNHRDGSLALAARMEADTAPWPMASEPGGRAVLGGFRCIYICANLPYKLWGNQMVFCTRCCGWVCFFATFLCFCKKNSKKDLRFAVEKTGQKWLINS